VFDWEQNIYQNAMNYEKNKGEIIKSRPKSQLDTGDLKNDNKKPISRRDPNSSFNSQMSIIKWTANKDIKLVNVDLQPVLKNKVTPSKSQSVKKDFKKLINLKTDVKIVNNKTKVDISRNSKKNLHLSDVNFFSYDAKKSSFNPDTKSTACGTTKNLRYVYNKNKSSIDMNMPLSPSRKLLTTKNNNMRSGEKELHDVLSNKNIKLHMTSNDNFLAKIKASS
jgi:hypothetical protein